MGNKKLVFSGVQPTGNLHLGNYLELKTLFHYKKKWNVFIVLLTYTPLQFFKIPITYMTTC